MADKALPSTSGGLSGELAEELAEDAFILDLPRWRPSLLQRTLEGLFGKPICDQCHQHFATCTVPIAGIEMGAARLRSTVRYPWKRKEYWCASCRSAVFDHGQEYAWGDQRGRFVRG